MMVSELIQRLQGEDQDAEVHFAYNYGDHARTTVAPKIRRVEEVNVVYSEYHRMPMVLDEDEEDRHTDTNSAVVLFS